MYNFVDSRFNTLLTSGGTPHPDYPSYANLPVKIKYHNIMYWDGVYLWESSRSAVAKPIMNGSYNFRFGENVPTVNEQPPLIQIGD